MGSNSIQKMSSLKNSFVCRLPKYISTSYISCRSCTLVYFTIHEVLQQIVEKVCMKTECLETIDLTEKIIK